MPDKITAKPDKEHHSLDLYVTRYQKAIKSAKSDREMHEELVDLLKNLDKQLRNNGETPYSDLKKLYRELYKIAPDEPSKAFIQPRLKECENKLKKADKYSRLEEFIKEHPTIYTMVKIGATIGAASVLAYTIIRYFS